MIICFFPQLLIDLLGFGAIDWLAAGLFSPEAVQQIAM